MKRYIMSGIDCGLVVVDNGDLVKYDDAAAEIEKLKCCGNCAHSFFHGVTICSIARESTGSRERCKFTPSRWKLHHE
jgi:hypothetical protein